jgi:hypothetical protein
MIQTIRLIPEDGALAIELVGDLAGILALTDEKNPRAGSSGVRQLTLVAGACYDLNRTIVLYRPRPQGFAAESTKPPAAVHGSASMACQGDSSGTAAHPEGSAPLGAEKAVQLNGKLIVRPLFADFVEEPCLEASTMGVSGGCQRSKAAPLRPTGRRPARARG